LIGQRSEQLEKLHAEHISRPEPAPSTNSHHHHQDLILSDEAVIDLCRRARNAPKFERLYDFGDVGDYDGDDSRADQALISIMAFYTQEPDQLDRLFRGSALCREKWTGRTDYRRRTINKALRNLTETYAPATGATLSRNGHHKPASPSLTLIEGRGRGRKPELVKLADVKPPGPRRYVLQDLVLEAYVTLLHGDGGVAKSLLALSLALAVARESGSWNGRRVEGGPVLYLDFELDAEEQARRVYQLCRGSGIEQPPESLLYMSAIGHAARAAFEAATEVCKERGVKLLVLDSHGVAMQGDAEAARDTIGFFVERIEPLRALGVAVLIIDHQSKMQAGQSYQSKGAFGSVFKSNLARSVIQAEATERGEGTLSVRLRQKKHNFGPLADPFGVKLSFSEEAVSLEPVELQASELAEESTLNAAERVKLALEDGPAYPWEIAETTGLAIKTVKNALTGLRKQSMVEATGEIESRTEQVRLSVPASFSYKRDGDGSKSGGVEDYVVENGEAIF
jgi:hypothetical protein